MSYPVPLRQGSIPSGLKTHHVYYKPNPAIPTAQQWQSLNGCNCSGLTGVRVRDHISECRAGLWATRQGKLLSKRRVLESVSVNSFPKMHRVVVRMSSVCNEDRFGMWASKWSRQTWGLFFTWWFGYTSRKHLGTNLTINISNNSKDYIQIAHYRSATDRHVHVERPQTCSDSILNKLSHLGSKQFDSTGGKESMD